MRRRPNPILLVAALVPLAGCAQIIPWAVNPTGAAAATATAAASSITQVDPAAIASASTGDIDRILRENPEAVNAPQLRDLRTDLANQPQSGGSPRRDDLVEEYRSQFDRRAQRIERRSSDRLVVRTREQFERPHGIRNTPRSHLDNETLPATIEQQQVMDVEPVRF